MRMPKLFFLALFWACGTLFGQNKQLLYDFIEIPQSLMINPGANVDFKWYSGIPMLSGISFQGGSSGISVNDIFAADGLDINDKIRARAINGMSIRDELSGTYQIELLNGGYRGKNVNEFYSFGIYHEGNAIGYWPKDYAILAIDGNANRLNEQFDLGHLKTRGEMVNVFHFGLNKRIDNKLTVGISAKLYSSILDFNSTRNKGYFVTTEGQNNILASTISADMQWRTSGVNEIKAANKNGTLTQTIIKRGFFGGSLGLGFDLGMTYDLNKHTAVTVSLLDVGFIYQTNDVENNTLNGSATVEGVEIILPDAFSDPNEDFWQDLVDEVETALPFENNTKSYIAFRPTKLNASIRYGFGEQLENREDCHCGPSAAENNRRARYTNSVGGQLYMINRPRGPQTALTAFYQRRFGNLMAVKTTYTVDKFSAANLGLGVSLQLGPVNIYLMGDNLLAYQNIAATHYASFQLGLNIISWGKK
ncbi:MAG: DUF5723 family protein [Flavobacteriaceae bacterium]